jgi:hypothetical protein
VSAVRTEGDVFLSVHARPVEWFFATILFGDRGIDVRSAVFGIESQTLDVIGVYDRFRLGVFDDAGYLTEVAVDTSIFDWIDSLHIVYTRFWVYSLLFGILSDPPA